MRGRAIGGYARGACRRVARRARRAWRGAARGVPRLRPWVFCGRCPLALARGGRGFLVSACAVRRLMCLVVCVRGVALKFIRAAPTAAARGLLLALGALLIRRGRGLLNLRPTLVIVCLCVSESGGASLGRGGSESVVRALQMRLHHTRAPRQGQTRGELPLFSVRGGSVSWSAGVWPARRLAVARDQSWSRRAPSATAVLAEDRFRTVSIHHSSDRQGKWHGSGHRLTLGT
mmetsp:Transcript_41653/g.97476  ORF Transcript_41653/g.97476 Transcript_41653/m.97476 type:complete len:232 (-) Transcript_41653:100-795(-)